MKLPRTKQCPKCPWKKSVDPTTIPYGYCETKHRNLKETIAKEGDINLGRLNVMACHHSIDGDQMYCVGWLHNQLGEGNNIALRMRMLDCENIGDLKITGEQHDKFEDTLPNVTVNSPPFAGL